MLRTPRRPSPSTDAGASIMATPNMRNTLAARKLKLQQRFA
jgi:hypothetical protein